MYLNITTLYHFNNHLNVHLMKNYHLLTFCFLFVLNLSSQCPDVVNRSANDCMYLIWQTPPIVMPTIANYTYDSGAGTSSSPALYRPGGGCGADKGGYSGSFEIDGITCTYVNGVLPIQLINYVLSENDKFIMINYTTASETNNDFFTIERSVDGLVFQSIGKIDGAGNSSKEISYQFVDEKPMAGINYYRIKQTDFDGQYSYSDIKSVRFKGLNNMNVSPRTTEGQINISTDIENYSVEVFNGSGQSVTSHRYISQISRSRSDNLYRNPSIWCVLHQNQ